MNSVFTCECFIRQGYVSIAMITVSLLLACIRFVGNYLYHFAYDHLHAWKWNLFKKHNQINSFGKTFFFYAETLWKPAGRYV